MAPRNTRRVSTRPAAAATEQQAPNVRNLAVPRGGGTTRGGARAPRRAIQVAPPLGGLVGIQQHRRKEIANIVDRMKERAPDSYDKTVVKVRITSVNELWTAIRATHEEILLREDAAESEYIVENEYDAIHLEYEEAMEWLLRTSINLAGREEGNQRRRARADDDEDMEESRPAKLPRLDLPTFDGKYENWDSFADQFASLVGDAQRINDTTKLQYLKSCLNGPAAELVKDVPILGINYASTWEALRKRFYNPRLTVNRLIDSIAKLPELKKESATELRAFVDEVQRIVRALTNLHAPVAHWDLWLVRTVELRVDSESRKMWESELILQDRQVALLLPDEENDATPRYPKFVDLIAFLERRAQSLAAIDVEKEDKRPSQPAKANSNSRSNSRRVHHVNSTSASKDFSCPHCSQRHSIWDCPGFLAKNPKERKLLVDNLPKVCSNCLSNHKLQDCNSKSRCRRCNGRHNTALCFKKQSDQLDTKPGNNASNKVNTSAASNRKTHVAHVTVGSELSVNACNASASKSRCSVLLATAQVTVIAPCGKQTRARVLLDQGSEATFVSESLVQLLGLKKESADTSLTGVGGCNAGVVKFTTSFVMQSRINPKFKLDIDDAYVLPRLTSELPSRKLVELNLALFENFELADPDFYIPDRVDIMLGADLYGQLLSSGVRSIPSTLLVAQNTVLGWVVSGPTQKLSSRRAGGVHKASVTAMRCSVNDNLNETIERFWTLEEIPTATKLLKPDEEACEKLFKETHARDIDGRFTVRLPLKSELPRVADETRRMAVGSLKHQLQRLSRDPNLAHAYSDFMDTYLELGHMVPIPPSELNNPQAWYLPHHAVLSGDPQAPKVRVVFDASRHTRDRQSLNDFLMPGPALQRDLALILLNWRRYQYVFTGDIVKMFRQIRIAREDQDLHRIVWSPSLFKPFTDYRLTTVTYGTASAPYLAIRTLLQLADDEKARFPLGAECLQTNTYVDDTFAGADELAMAVRKRDELISILDNAGITLDKWAANHPDLLPKDQNASKDNAAKQIAGDNAIKALGVRWSPISDKFYFTNAAPKNSIKLTKRSVYSEIAQLFDPLGWLAPITIIAKILMQDLWIDKCEWDAPLPTEIQTRWLDYCKSLSYLPELSIDRWLGLLEGKTFEIHGFSDASARAYAAAVYLRIDDGNGNFHTALLAAKTKPAPIKTKSIPNLELCGATLLVKLVCYLQQLDFLKDAPVFLWSDSQIVLAWLKKHPCNWKTFVANRVSIIQTELPSAKWFHVPTKQNPADLATRGVTPTDLARTDLWWHGPSWLVSPSHLWPQAPKPLQALHAQRHVASPDEPELLSRYSSLTVARRIVAWCLRPALQYRRKKAGQGSYPRQLTVVDLDHAQIALVILAQTHAFSNEITDLRSNRPLVKHHPLRKLNAFVDRHDGILRVGGRLSNANVPNSVQHPPVLPRLSALSLLFVRHAHRRVFHGGPTLTTSILLRYAWILGMRILVKSVINRCITCQRHKPRLAQQLMGNLPAERVTPARAFTTTGLDYAGPFQLRTSKGRGQKSYKGYIALFVCFATKAIHLEVVSDLTTAKFLSAYRRFTSRRGTPKKMFSDNATTFRGADAELRSMFDDASKFYGSLSATFADEGTSWTFIPPNTPHYGGLWEAGVKSTKHLLRRTLGEYTLTFEEMSTVLAEIEACLNSRPLCALRSDPDDLQALTPYHLIIGAASGIIPDEATPSVPENRLDRFQLLQRIRENFWKRWLNEYVLQLQERQKWREPTVNFEVGQLVIMKDDRYPPSKWPLGRVLQVHPGPDGLVRVVTVKTATSTLRRHIACLAPLNLDQPEEVNVLHVRYLRFYDEVNV